VLIVPPTANTATITLKGVTGDTGQKISRTTPTVLGWDTTAPDTTLGITVSAAIAGLKIVFI